MTILNRYGWMFEVGMDVRHVDDPTMTGTVTRVHDDEAFVRFEHPWVLNDWFDIDDLEPVEAP